jgi:polysaccharide pyruvyl transferase WcaK-like protein
MLNSFKNRLRLAWRLPQLYLASRFGMPTRQPGPARLVRSVLIVPSDPFGIIGAKGDEAMLVSLIENLTANIHGVKVSLLCDRDALPESISTLGVGIERGWISPWSFGALKKTIEPYDALVIIGADILDGYYSLLSAARYWVAADLAARQGKTVVITGFSFNASPPQLLKAFLTPLPDSVNICLRDPVSQERFNRFIGIPGRAKLVADIAFNLQPHMQTLPVAAIAAWCEQQRAAARMVVGFNIHPMLFKHPTVQELDALVHASVQSISAAVKLRASSMVLIPHDYRPFPKGDLEILSRIYHALPSHVQKHCHLVEGHLHAAELKALAGKLDLVITGRMHLAIASLGMGTPVAGITYQDKFHGLFQHFGLSSEFLASVAVLLDAERFQAWLIGAIDAQKLLKTQVDRNLVAVKALSRENFSALLV